MRASRHILVVDDDREIRDLVGRALEKEGFRVTRASDGVEMRKRLEAGAIDLIVLDIMLPGKDGLALCRDLRAQSIATPVILLTARGDEIDRVLGLEMGADDYVPKPFSARELVARIRAIFRRTGLAHTAPSEARARFFRFDGWRLDMAKRELQSADGTIVSLSTGEFELLKALVEHPQMVLSRDQLLDLSRGRSAIVFDRSIDIQVSRLRRKLRDDAKSPSLIKTVWGGGYLFTPDVVAE